MKKIISWKKFEALISDSENLQKSVKLIKVDSRKRSVDLVKVFKSCKETISGIKFYLYTKI